MEEEVVINKRSKKGKWNISRISIRNCNNIFFYVNLNISCACDCILFIIYLFSISFFCLFLFHFLVGNLNIHISTYTSCKCSVERTWNITCMKIWAIMCHIPMLFFCTYKIINSFLTIRISVKYYEIRIIHFKYNQSSLLSSVKITLNRFFQKLNHNNLDLWSF